MRAAERVDALRVVSDDQRVAVQRRHPIDDLALQEVRVLVLVDEDRVELALQGLARLRHLDEQPLPVHQEIVEVHRVHLRLALGEASRDAQDLLLQRAELRPLAREHVGDRTLRVHRSRVEVDEHVGARKAPLPHSQPEVRGRAGHQLLGVLAIEKAEPVAVVLNDLQ